MREEKEQEKENAEILLHIHLAPLPLSDYSSKWRLKSERFHTPTRRALALSRAGPQESKSH